MQALTVKSIEATSHPETKILFWFLFAGTKGGLNRIRIITSLRNQPSNKNKLAQDLNLDYKGVEHHLNTLEKNNLVTKLRGKYAAPYFVSPFFEDAETVFDEIVTKLKKMKGDKWSR